MAPLKLLQFSVLLFTLLESCRAQRRIYNGEDAKLKQFPYMAVVRGSLTCGGALVSEKFVLTAAHCVMDVDKDQTVTVILGVHNYYDNGEKGRKRIVANKFWIHENFTMPSAVNDLAIIELPEPVEFTDFIRPIKISTKKDLEMEKETVAVLSGWGYTSKEVRMSSEILQTTRLKLMPYDECTKFQDFYIEKITKNNICAKGTSSSSGKPISSPCDGDSGGPLVLVDTQELIGVTSFVKDAENGTQTGNDCSTDTAPAVFVRVAPYLDWIASKTNMKFE